MVLVMSNKVISIWFRDNHHIIHFLYNSLIREEANFNNWIILYSTNEVVAPNYAILSLFRYFRMFFGALITLPHKSRTHKAI